MRFVKFLIVLASVGALSVHAQIVRTAPPSSVTSARSTNIIVLPVVPTTADISNIAWNTVVPSVPTIAWNTVAPSIAGIAWDTVYANRAALIPNQGAIGGYTFAIDGYGGRFYGTGSYDSATGKFSGDLICEGSSSCGSSGRMWCGSGTSCAWLYAYNSLYGYYYVVGASALPINAVVKSW